MFGSYFNKKKTKNLDEVMKKWKISDDDNISDVSNSEEEFTNSKIQTLETESSKSAPMKNLNDLSSCSTPG